MAIRYSGDVEVRLAFDEGLDAYVGQVRAPHFHMRAKLDRHLVALSRKSAASSEAYDRAARAFISAALKRHRRLPVSEDSGQLVIRRTFQAPCPVRIERR